MAGRGKAFEENPKSYGGYFAQKADFVLNSLFVALVVSLTVSTATVAGIAASYGIVTGILYGFAYRQARHSGNRVLVASANSASGD